MISNFKSAKELIIMWICALLIWAIGSLLSSSLYPSGFSPIRFVLNSAMIGLTMYTIGNILKKRKSKKK